MINFNHLTQEELTDNGLKFETTKEAELFAEIIREELEVRIADAITKYVAQEKIREFDLCKTQEECTAWLERNCPEYFRIVSDKQEEMNREIMEFRDRIPGVIVTTPANKQDITIEEMELSVRSYNCLKRAGLRTVSDICAYGDLKGIRNLSPRCIEEIKKKLWEITVPRSFPEIHEVYDGDDDEVPWRI